VRFLPLVNLGVAVSLLAAPRSGASTDPAGPAACRGPAHHQFDFFVGDWDAYDVSAPDRVVARNRVTTILGGCVVHEVYSQNDGLEGESFSIYDPSREQWHQTWVTNRGTLLLLDGRLESGRMVLSGTEHTAGVPSVLRGVWEARGQDVHEVAERSRDGGKTWEPVFDMIFRRHRPAGHR
jgi:hypothetical protein